MLTLDRILTLPCTEPEYKLSPWVVYYIENRYDETINGFIIDNYQDIVSAFASVGYGFVYFPLLFQNFSALDDWCSPGTRGVWDYMLGSDYHEFIPAPGFVIPMEGGYDHSMMCRYQNAMYSETVSELVERITKGRRRPPLPAPSRSRFFGRFEIFRRFRSVSEQKDPNAYELYRILKPRSFGNNAVDHYSTEQKEKVDQMLREMERLGIGRQLLIQILTEGQRKEFARMRVTSSYHVFLESQEWGNKEVELPPLHRAIYLLYLKHEKGIKIKALAGRHEEIFEIYRRISNGLNTDVQRERVIKAIDPFDNRINTIFSFIRRTFESLLGSPSIANYYGITGTRGQVRRIELDRKYVTWEKEL